MAYREWMVGATIHMGRTGWYICRYEWLICMVNVGEIYHTWMVFLYGKILEPKKENGHVSFRFFVFGVVWCLKW